MPKRKQPGQLDNWKSDLERICKLMDKGRFRQVITPLKRLVVEYPDTPAPILLLSACLSEIGKSNEALKFLQDAEKRFPNHFDILYHIAETLVELKEYEKAEPYYRRSLDVTPARLTEERSGCYVGLGASLWEQHKRDEALQMWRLALGFDPNNDVARQNLEALTNEYKEPSAPSRVFDDLYHFQEIHQERYLKQHGRKEFETLEEANRVMEAIRVAWNQHIAPRGNEIDTLTPAEKTELFIHIEFEFE